MPGLLIKSDPIAPPRPAPRTPQFVTLVIPKSKIGPDDSIARVDNFMISDPSFYRARSVASLSTIMDGTMDGTLLTRAGFHLKLRHLNPGYKVGTTLLLLRVYIQTQLPSYNVWRLEPRTRRDCFGSRSRCLQCRSQHPFGLGPVERWVHVCTAWRGILRHLQRWLWSLCRRSLRLCARPVCKDSTLC
jgi:hypothetical protein